MSSEESINIQLRRKSFPYQWEEPEKKGKRNLSRFIIKSMRYWTNEWVKLIAYKKTTGYSTCSSDMSWGAETW